LVRLKQRFGASATTRGILLTEDDLIATPFAFVFLAELAPES
jgi:hypothetical protein